jgi:hypothetical protein
MGSPDLVLNRAFPDQDEVPMGKALELGGRYDNDKDELLLSNRHDDRESVKRAAAVYNASTYRQQEMSFPQVGSSI